MAHLRVFSWPLETLQTLDLSLSLLQFEQSRVSLKLLVSVSELSFSLARATLSVGNGCRFPRKTCSQEGTTYTNTENGIHTVQFFIIEHLS
jgi:hypothetical protein